MRIQQALRAVRQWVSPIARTSNQTARLSERTESGTGVYSSSSRNGQTRPVRDNRVDSLRGLMLAIMMIDHLGGPLETLTLEPIGFVSAAEGFVFLSGYMYALVYARNAVSSTTLFYRSLKRAALIYRYHMACLLLIVGLAVLSPALVHYWSMEEAIAHPVSWSLASLLLVNTPTFFDILPMYVVFVLVTPAVIWGLKHRQTLVVLGLSLVLWGFGRIADPIQSLDEFFVLDSRTPFFNLLSWQLIWLFGVLLGFYRETVQLRLRQISPGLLIAVALFVGLLCLIRHQVISLDLSREGIALTRSNLGWLRMLDVIGVIALMAWLMARVPITARLPWFTELGRASIQVFTFHLLVIYFVMPIGWRIHEYGALIYGLFTVLCLLSLTIPAYLTRHRRRSR